MAGLLVRNVHPDPQDRRIRRSWYFLTGSFFILGLVIVLHLLAGAAQRIDWIIAALVVVVGSAAVVNRGAVEAREAGRRAEAESFARILQGLSRSVSPDAIVDAIVDEVGLGTGADHIVVVRLRPDAQFLEATLVTRRVGVPPSSTILPISELEDPLADGSGRVERLQVPIPIEAAATSLTRIAVPAGRGQVAVPAGAGVAARGWTGNGFDHGPVDVLDRPAEARFAPAEERRTRTAARPGDRRRPWSAVGAVASLRAFAAGETGPGAMAAPDRAGPGTRIAERLAYRVATVYGLSHTLAAPLQTEAGVVGAIVLSRRTADPWPAAARRVLRGAAIEASAALARAYSHRAAEARASTDALTGLPNRRYFDEFCGLLARRRRSDDAIGVLMVDIDHFKRLNDLHGHAMGDQVLRAVAHAIAGAVREDDVPARFGGEEFAILLRNPSAQVALEIGQRVREAVHALDLSTLGIREVTVSVGVALSGEPDQPIPDLVDRADRAMYAAKRAGRNRVVAA